MWLTIQLRESAKCEPSWKTLTPQIQYVNGVANNVHHSPATKLGNVATNNEAKKNSSTHRVGVAFEASRSGTPRRFASPLRYSPTRLRNSSANGDTGASSASDEGSLDSYSGHSNSSNISRLSNKVHSTFVESTSCLARRVSRYFLGVNG